MTASSSRRIARNRMILALASATLVVASVLPVSSAGAQIDPLRVLILGDSYSAGNGAGSYYGPKDCYRSRNTWGELAARELGERSGREVQVTNRACSGGVTTDLTGGDVGSGGIYPNKLQTVRSSTISSSNQDAANASARQQ
ncbi:MAG: hypothetical protein FJW94_14625 [Actinobacteria bacterium]|nr:hypothetical protein [Actinomycetota bacterium]